MAVQPHKVAPAKETQLSAASMRLVLIHSLEERGLVAPKNDVGIYQSQQGIISFAHPETPLKVRVYQNYAEVFQKPNGKKTDTRWFSVTDTQEILRHVESLS